MVQLVEQLAADFELEANNKGIEIQVLPKETQLLHGRRYRKTSAGL